MFSAVCRAVTNGFLIMTNLRENVDSLTRAFKIQPGEVISLVGAGGKTTLMFALARELTLHEGVVVTTTTTKIFPPSSSDTSYVLVSEDENEIRDFILRKGYEYGHITVVSEKVNSSGKLKGINVEQVKMLRELGVVTFIIIEADGAARRPLKAPDTDYEPVIPQDTTLVIPVVGIDVLGCELNEEHVFRSEIAAKLAGIEVGGNVSLEVITILVTHKSGMAYGSPVHARIVPFINKTDLTEGLKDARNLANMILDAKHPQIDRVVLGHAKLKPPVSEVVVK